MINNDYGSAFDTRDYIASQVERIENDPHQLHLPPEDVVAIKNAFGAITELCNNNPWVDMTGESNRSNGGIPNHDQCVEFVEKYILRKLEYNEKFIIALVINYFDLARKII